MRKLHAKRHLAYDPQTTGVVWTRCFRHVEQGQIAVFEQGVTCKRCLARLAFDKECEEWRREAQTAK